ncbi:hypothetical protein BCR44DRAFT_34387 [Catenaria anguillulae PL171]|uniref:Uncharacterized protein n=1 Tax=Catenaria anguillulae PL171 TaxID=765915 RepID=A0A1Y2HMZ2_9FUNG|nr:hypothetical protein BCR44DRAFT_34387 [Catenaria anguillulae PL171]
MATAAGANMGSGTLRGIRSVEQRGMEGFSPFRSVTPQVQGLSPSRQGHHRSSGAMGTGGRR